MSHCMFEDVLILSLILFSKGWAILLISPKHLPLDLLMWKTSSSFDISSCPYNANELSFSLDSWFWSYMELPQSAPTENTLLSFIKTFLCPELSSWLHQMPAESPPVLLASGPDLKHRLCLSRANRVSSMNKCQQVWRVQGSGPGVGTGRKEGLPGGEMTLAVLYMFPVKTHSCLAPKV